MSEWRNTSIKIVLALFVICIMLFAFSFVMPTKFSAHDMAEAYDLPIGQSMFAGDSILDGKDMVQVPLLSNVPFIAHLILTLDLKGILLTLTTGVVPFDFTTISGEGIDGYGNAVGFEGPGFLTYDNNSRLTVKGPNTYVWGYSVPYSVLTRTENGVDLYENGTLVRSIPANEIRNLNYSNGFYNVTTIQNWYNHDSHVGSNFTLTKGISGFSDGRSSINNSDIARIFGQNVSDYVDAYPVGSPILLYMGNTTQQDGELYYTTLGSHPEYGNAVREFNARQFVEAWNNTIIPPNCSGSGQDYVSFGSAADAEAPGGSAADGVCPPARALRGAVLAEGFGMPTGMTGDENAVLFGYNPAYDIKVTNNHTYPVKIVMWTKGEGTGMVIYAQVLRYVPS